MPRRYFFLEDREMTSEQMTVAFPCGIPSNYKAYYKDSEIMPELIEFAELVKSSQNHTNKTVRIVRALRAYRKAQEILTFIISTAAIEEEKGGGGMREEVEAQSVNQDPYREVAIKIVRAVLDNQKSLPPPGVESSRPEAWKEVAGILRTHTQALQRRVEELEQINESLNVQNCHLMQPPHEARG